jgi:hypothetical protein
MTILTTLITQTFGQKTPTKAFISASPDLIGAKTKREKKVLIAIRRLSRG